MAGAPRKKVLVVEDGGEVSLHGSTKQGVFTDAQLAQVANMPEIKKVSALSRQPITKLPPFVAIEELRIGVLPKLESLAGLEKMVTLRRVEFEQIDLYPDALARLRELPELVELTIIAGNLNKLPDGIWKLPSLTSGSRGSTSRMHASRSPGVRRSVISSSGRSAWSCPMCSPR